MARKLSKHRPFSAVTLFHEHEQRFFSQVVQGKTYRYNSYQYLYRDVEEVAERYGVKINYNNSTTSKYFRYGSYNFTVVSVTPSPDIPEISKDPVLFDIKELAT